MQWARRLTTELDKKEIFIGVSFVNIKSSLRIGCVSGAKISLHLASSTTATTEQGGPPTTNTGPKDNDLICFGNTILVVDNTSLLPWRL